MDRIWILREKPLFLVQHPYGNESSTLGSPWGISTGFRMFPRKNKVLGGSEVADMIFSAQSSIPNPIQMRRFGGWTLGGWDLSGCK